MKKITILESAILQQKSQLGSLTTSLRPPLNDSAWTCQNWNGVSQSELGLLSSKIINSTSSLTNTLNNLSNQTSEQYFTWDSSSANSTAQNLQQSIYSTGTSVSTLPAGEQTNWLAQNWVTGNGSLTQIDQKVQETQAGTYVKTCSLATPYFDGTSCISCPTSTPYFNIATRACIACNSYNSNTHTCTVSSTSTNQTTEPGSSYNKTNYDAALNRIVLPTGTTTDSLSSQAGQACPTDTPFLAQGKCINCAPPTPLFNYSSSSCTTCPADTTFVPEKHQCVSSIKQYVTNLPAASNRLILPSGQTISDLQNQQNILSSQNNVIVCPAETPFYNNVTCINCPAQQFFNVQGLTCQSCPADSVYNQTSLKCEVVKFYSSLNNGNWTSINPEVIRQTVYNTSLLPGSTACPAATPFYDGSKCISCLTDQQFSFDGLKC